MERNSDISFNRKHENLNVANYKKIRAGFILKGTSLAAWCKENNIFRQNARDCILGNWRGPAARKLLARLLTESRVEK